MKIMLLINGSFRSKFQYVLEYNESTDDFITK